MKTLTILSMIIMIFTGCTKSICEIKPNGTTSSVSNVLYLCVGMDYSARFGSCPGCEKDARSLDNLMKSKYGYKGDLLISSQATKSAVVQMLTDGIAKTTEDGLFLFFYSGHGGQEYLGGGEPDEADSQDEFLCLYDTYLLDDDIWKIISSCKGRVFLYFDACHSATMYRSVSSELKLTENEKNGTNKKKATALSTTETCLTKGFTFNPSNFATCRALSNDQGKSTVPEVRLLCWSGCKEAEYSYGSVRGGTLTQSVINNWKSGYSYGRLWNYTRRQVISNQPGQNPVATYVGSGFNDDMEAFK